MAIEPANIDDDFGHDGVTFVSRKAALVPERAHRNESQQIATNRGLAKTLRVAAVVLLQRHVLAATAKRAKPCPRV